MIYPIEIFNIADEVRRIQLEPEQKVIVTAGPGSYLVSGSLEYGNEGCHVLIGRYSSLAHRITFEVGYNHDYHRVTTYPFDDLSSTDKQNHADKVNKNQVIVGNDVWLGCDVTIMGGVRIGNGAVIGAGAVVAKDIPPYAVVVGNPARVIKYRFSDEIIDKLQKIKWWNWEKQKIQSNFSLMEDVEAFCDKFYPEVEDNIVSSKVSEELANLHYAGWKLYLLSADFTGNFPVWKSVINQYIDYFTADDKVALLLEVSSGDEAIKGLDEIRTQLSLAGDSAPLISSYQKCTEGISFEVLPYVDCYITNRDDISSQYVDYAVNYGVNVISGLDKYIFEKERGKCIGN